MYIVRRAAISLIALPVVLACSSSSRPTSEACVPGASSACTCATGEAGVQTCLLGGGGFDQCACTGVPPIDSGSDDAGSASDAGDDDAQDPEDGASNDSGEDASVDSGDGDDSGDACGNCASTECSSQVSACDNDSACVTFANCLEYCGSDNATCDTGCESIAGSTAVDEASALGSCLSASCSTQCQ
jgi:hypothetical protein